MTGASERVKSSREIRGVAKIAREDNKCRCHTVGACEDLLKESSFLGVHGDTYGRRINEQRTLGENKENRESDRCMECLTSNLEMCRNPN